jgi:triphosphatase
MRHRDWSPTTRWVKTYLRHCKALQQQLGSMNDAVTAVALAERLGGTRQTELAPAVAALAGWAAAEQDAARRRLRRGWRKFDDLPPPF